MTHLEETSSISSDLLFKREYRTQRISLLLYIINSQPESTVSSDRNKVNPLVNLRLIKSTNQSKDKRKMMADSLVDPTPRWGIRCLEHRQTTMNSIIGETIELLIVNLNITHYHG